MHRLAPLALLAALSTSQAAAQLPLPLKRAPTKTTPGITTADLTSRIYRFADDSMNGRRAGRAEALNGTEYIAAELRRLGLQPAGENGGYFQDVPLANQRLDSTSTLSVAGATLRAGVDFLGFGTLGWKSDGARPVEFVYGGDAYDTVAVLAPEQVRGKVLVLRSVPPPDLRALAASEGIRPYQRMLAAAAATAVYTPALQPARISAAMPTAQVVATLTPSRLSTSAAQAYSLDLTTSAVGRIFGTGDTEPKKGATASAALDLRFELIPRPGRNVVAILPGTDPALRSQYVAIGAHSDHVGFRLTPVDHDSVRAFNTIARQQGVDSPDRAPADDERARIRALTDSLHTVHGGARPDSIMNGADDDGSGSMGVLEIAEAFAGARQRPKRSLLFVWHVAEEEGMIGSRWFTDHPTVPRDSIVAQLNVDMIGRGGSDDATGNAKDGTLLFGNDAGYLQLIGSRRLSTELGDLVVAVNDRTKAGFTFDYALDADGHPQNIYCRSDHYMYARYGIPIVFFTTGGHRDYHQVTDEPQYLRYDHYRRVTQLIHDVALAVGNLDHRPVVDKPKPDPQGACRQ
jgi:hypothetical protein